MESQKDTTNRARGLARDLAKAASLDVEEAGGLLQNLNANHLAVEMFAECGGPCVLALCEAVRLAAELIANKPGGCPPGPRESAIADLLTIAELLPHPATIVPPEPGGNEGGPA